VDQQGDCALALKGKQGTLFEDVVLLLDDPELKASASAPLVEADHGRIETRTATVSTEIDWLMKQHQWPGLQAMGNVVRVRETAEKTKAETAHYLLSRVLSPDRFNAAVRQHWSVENNLRWRLDVVMNEDQDRTRMGHGPQNLAVLRHLVINAMQKDQKARCAENSNTKAGTTISSTDSWRRFEKRLPWTACAAAFEPCSPSVILQSEGSAAIPGLKRKWRTDLAVLVEGRLGGKG